MDAQSPFEALPAGPVRRLFESISQHDLGGMVACFAEDYVNETPIHPDRSFTGREQVRKNWSTILAGLRDLQPYVVRATTAPDGMVWVEWGQRGTRPDGVPVALAGVSIFTLDADAIAAVRFYLEPVERESGDVNANVHSIVGQIPATAAAGSASAASDAGASNASGDPAGGGRP
ncbi:nuclear transport factor 2 family protein [Sinomonas sp. P10A9]|uniref:Nuclear transport factor 2 family protein n=1 Tax=Sinomonas puerhi TaxID=3238584 RepID=A0AB39L258_9MICC